MVGEEVEKKKKENMHEQRNRGRIGRRRRRRRRRGRGKRRREEEGLVGGGGGGGGCQQAGDLLLHLARAGRPPLSSDLPDRESSKDGSSPLLSPESAVCASFKQQDRQYRQYTGNM